MKKTRLIGALFLALILLATTFQTVLAFPPLPSSFYGQVKVNGLNVPTSTIVTARINGVTFASTTVQMYQGNTVYSLDVPGDDSETPGVIEGGVEGNTVVFFIGTTQAAQTGTWHSGTNVNLNLTGVASFVHLFLPYIRR